MGELWGPSRNLDYWAALKGGAVEPEERRAVALLASMTDERRFSAYCVTGQLAAMGNVTKRIYVIRRYATVLELEDGRPKASWCINGPDRYDIPETDHVVLMRNLIEGEELAFRMTGNPSPAGSCSGRPDGRIRTPLTASMIGEDPVLDRNGEFTYFLDTRYERECFAVRERLKRERALSALTLKRNVRDAAAYGGRAGMGADVRPSECEPPGGIEIGGVLNGSYGYIFGNSSTAFTGSSLTNNNIPVHRGGHVFTDVPVSSASWPMPVRVPTRCRASEIWARIMREELEIQAHLAGGSR